MAKACAIIIGGLSVVAGLAMPSPSDQQPIAHKVIYSTEVKPILQAHCYQCHGPDSPAANLRLDTLAGLTKGGASGKIIVAGESSKSLIVRRILGQGGQPKMPLGFSALAPDDVKTISLWIDQGAQFDSDAGKKHWSYIEPVAAAIPKHIPIAWRKNPIDAFVWTRMNKAGLSPSPQAPKLRLLRRVYLDLVGYPPSIKAQNAFLADKSPEAYEKVVDKLLASPHFGERMATPWLDLARYADSNGYEKDLNRTIWPYRDWVIQAFNRDLPYNQFVVDQIAGDMLPHPSQADLVATGFNRNTMLNQEGGVDEKEQRWLTLVDRVGTLGQTFLGTTLQCTQCHDHKYDPFSQKEFYQLLAFFEPSDEPTLPLYDPGFDRIGAALDTITPSEVGIASFAEVGIANAGLSALRDMVSNEQSITTLILREKPHRGAAKVPLRIKGAYTSPGQLVSADTPHALPPLSKSEPPNRLGLAEWIVDRRNPLTARVEVNRLWSMLFGIGLVKTESDFGTQGERPLDQPLLDWMSVHFMNSGWSVKKLIRLIVTSKTYKQDSAVDQKKFKADPDNRFLARGSRFRLSAEQIRDNALRIAGQLSLEVGGPSVFPSQPAGIWNAPYSDEQWATSSGKDFYRRGLYTFWKRSSPYPEFVLFDATSREACTVNRIVTDTPLQALALLDDPVYWSAAKSFAREILSASADSNDQRIRLAYRKALIREPSKEELAVMSNLLAKEEAFYAGHQGLAVKIASPISDSLPKESISTDAAYVVVCQVLLNLDETITKE